MERKRHILRFSSWQEAVRDWDDGAVDAQNTQPIRGLSQLPKIPGISKETAPFLKWKSLKWMIAKDENWAVAKYVLKRPFRHAWRYLVSLIKRKPYIRDDDFFLYGCNNVEEFKRLLDNPKSVFVVGFSYCEKPHECPSGRFNDQCIHDPENLVCRQCFIGKSVNLLPTERTVPLFIPTIHYIGQKIFETIERYPNNEIVFLITACELTLEMFGDWGNLAGVKGIGVRLDGRICNTMRAFELSETGIKPGLTVVLERTQKRILDLLEHWSSKNDQKAGNACCNSD